jgi:ATP-binding cassette, subfamily B, bacterial
MPPAVPSKLDRLREVTRGYGWPLAAIGLLSAAAAFIEAATVLAIFQLLELTLTGQSVAEVDFPGLPKMVFTPGPLLVGSILALLGRFGLQLSQIALSATTVSRYEATLRDRAFGAFTAADWPAQSDEKAGALHTLLMMNVAHVTEAAMAVTQLVVAAFSFTVVLFPAVVLEPAVLVLMVAAPIVLFGLVRPITRAATRVSARLTAINLRFASSVNQSVTLAREIRTLGVTDRVALWVQGIVRNYRGQRIRSSFLLHALPAAYQNLAFFALVGAMALLGWMGSTSLTSFAALGLLARALQYTQMAQRAYHQVSRGLPYLDQLADLEGRYNRSRPQPGERRLERVEELRLSGVRYRYPSAQNAALRGVELTIRAGESVGIVGPSGGGKSTLLQLLLRLRAPTEGDYRVNGSPALDFHHPDWCRLIAFVGQEPGILDATLEENIRFFRPIDEEAVRDAARRASLEAEVLEMAHGFQTMAGRGGIAISGGQRQRICLARALAGEPEVIVFDEPTSSLDLKSEARVHDALRQLRDHTTLIVVSHRMSTLELCDRIVVVDGGRICAEGPRDEVARTNVWFRETLQQSRAAARGGAQL